MAQKNRKTDKVTAIIMILLSIVAMVMAQPFIGIYLLMIALVIQRWDYEQ